jgi:hypothetical protein
VLNREKISQFHGNKDFSAGVLAIKLNHGNRHVIDNIYIDAPSSSGYCFLFCLSGPSLIFLTYVWMVVLRLKDSIFWREEKTQINLGLYSTGCSIKFAERAFESR